MLLILFHTIINHARIQRVAVGPEPPGKSQVLKGHYVGGGGVLSFSLHT